MKLLLATSVYLLISAAFCAGILMLMHGKPALLIAVAAVYVISFARSCLAAH